MSARSVGLTKEEFMKQQALLIHPGRIFLACLGQTKLIFCFLGTFWKKGEGGKLFFLRQIFLTQNLV